MSDVPSCAVHQTQESDYLAKDSGYPYQAVTVGDSSNLIVGDSIIAVGNARGRGISVNNGIISGVGNLPNGKPNYAWEAIPTREQLVTILYRIISKLK